MQRLHLDIVYSLLLLSKLKSNMSGNVLEDKEMWLKQIKCAPFVSATC